MAVALIVVGIVVLGVAGAGVVCFRLFAVPSLRPLSGTDRATCRQLVTEGKGYPFLCAYFVKRAVCGCQPCPMLRQAREATTPPSSWRDRS